MSDLINCHYLGKIITSREPKDTKLIILPGFYFDLIIEFVWQKFQIIFNIKLYLAERACRNEREFYGKSVSSFYR